MSYLQSKRGPIWLDFSELAQLPWLKIIELDRARSSYLCNFWASSCTQLKLARAISRYRLWQWWANLNQHELPWHFCELACFWASSSYWVSWAIDTCTITQWQLSLNDVQWVHVCTCIASGFEKYLKKDFFNQIRIYPHILPNQAEWN